MYVLFSNSLETLAYSIPWLFFQSKHTNISAHLRTYFFVLTEIRSRKLKGFTPYHISLYLPKIHIFLYNCDFSFEIWLKTNIIKCSCCLFLYLLGITYSRIFKRYGSSPWKNTHYVHIENSAYIVHRFMGYPGAHSYFLEFLIEGKLSLYKLHEWLLHWKEIIFFFFSFLTI